MKRVALAGWKHGFHLIPFIRLLRESDVRTLSLREAVGILDQVRMRQAVDLYFDTSEDATAFTRQADELAGVTSAPADIPDEFAASVRNSNSSDSQASYEVAKSPGIDVASVGAEDIESLAVTWLDCNRLPLNSPERAKLEWIWELEYDLLEEAPEKLWLLILAVHAKDQSPRIQEVLSADPMEQLLGRYGAEFIDRVETQARIDPGFAKLGGGVWQSTMSQDIWLRVQAVWDRRGWDGIPSE